MSTTSVNSTFRNSKPTTSLTKHCSKTTNLTCIVVGVVDLHRRLGSIVAETAVLLQQLQTFIAIINWAPTVVCTQHCNGQVNKMEKRNTCDLVLSFCLRCSTDMNKEQQPKIFHI